MSIENMFGDLDKIDILAETKAGEVVMVLVCNGFIDGSPETQKALLDKMEGYLNHTQSEEFQKEYMPFADNDKNYPYHEPEEPQTKEQLWAKLVEQNKKLSPDDPDARRKLYNHCCMFGTARDAVDLFEEIQGVPMADSSYRDAIARYLYLGQREKALQTAERLATSRLWAVAGPTQVRPMSFFEDPNLREFLLEPESLRRIREAALIDNGTLTRK